MVKVQSLLTCALFLPVDCLSEEQGDCYTFSNRLFVFGDLATDSEAQEVVLPAIQRYIQGRTEWSDVDPRLLDVVFVVAQDGEVVLPDPLPGTPTISPVTRAPSIGKILHNDADW